MLEIRKCSYDEVLDSPQFEALCAEYAQESTRTTLGDYNPQRDTYAMLEKAGVLHTLGAFNGDELVGFISVLFNVTPHYGKRIAVSESYFVSTKHRAGGIGVKLLKSAEQLAVEYGAVGLFISAPVNGTLEKIMPRLSYVQTNSVFFKGL